MAQLLLHLANITIYENTFITDSRKFPFPWEFPGTPDLLFPFPGNSATIAMDVCRLQIISLELFDTYTSLVEVTLRTGACGKLKFFASVSIY